MKAHRNISTALACLCVWSSAQADTEVVRDFEKLCIDQLRAEEVPALNNHADGWSPITKEQDPYLNSYFANIENAFGEKLHYMDHFERLIGERTIFLTRYSYAGMFEARSTYCIVSDFYRDDWQLPVELQSMLDGKINETAHSVIILDGQKSVGHWRSSQWLNPLSLLTASAFPKGGVEHEASGFYGLHLTAVKTETNEIIDNLN